MNSALQLLNQFEASTADDFPLGPAGAEVLDQIERVSRLCTELKDFYKTALTKNPNCVPGWVLKPGAIRRSLRDPQAVWERVQDVMTSQQFMASVKVEVLRLQDQWARVAGIPPSRAKGEFNQLMDGLLVQLQSAPSLVRSKSPRGEKDFAHRPD
jgi:hypothetical protein